MPRVKANQITINYDQQGTGEPLILIPFLAADYACYAFQVAEYAKHFTCISIDLRGTGESDKPEGVYSTELFADDIAAFMQALGIPNAHISGLSLGAASGMWLAAKYPNRVKSLSLHSGWAKTDSFLKTVVEGWQVTAKALGSVPEMVILNIFPWCFTPELYAAKPEYIQSLAEFVRGRPAQPLATFLEESNAVIAHDVAAQLGQITVPTQITFGRHDEARRLDATPFDVKAVELGHHGKECSFEAILKKHKLDGDPALVMLGKIVNGADTDNTLWNQPEGPGLEAIAEGFRHLGFKDDHELNSAEWIVYDALYAYCQEMVRQGKPDGMFK